MKTFPTLYKRTKTGAIQEWKISVDAGDIDHAPIIIKQAGQLGTDKPTLHRETVHEGKQKRSPLEQAEFQAESDWKRKHDEGYKSLEDLGIVTQSPDGYIYNGETSWVLETILQSALPTFNSDASGNVKPMLATDWKKIKVIPYPVIVQPKLDGVRCLLIADSSKGNDVVFLSRSGKEYTSLNHIGESVRHFFARNPDDHYFILDGEIYSDELNFQEIVSAVKAYKPNSEKLKFRAYDIVTEHNQVTRLAMLKLYVKDIASEHITELEWRTAENDKQVKDYHDEFVINGHEGAMIRFVEGKYGQGQRSRELLKVKQFDETEFLVINFEFGQRDEDLIAVCVLDKDVKGKQFRAKLTGTRAQKEELFEKWDKFDGLRLLTVKHFGWTEDKLPRFPVGKAMRDYE